MLLLKKFTFQYVSIISPAGEQRASCILHLHSNMFLLFLHYQQIHTPY